MFSPHADAHLVMYTFDGEVQPSRVINLSHSRSRGMDDDEAARRILAIAFHDRQSDAERIVIVAATGVR